MFVLAGVSGHVGGVAARELIAQGKKVRVLVRDAKKAEPWHKDAEVTVVALEDSAGLARALAGAEAFYTLLPGDYGGGGFRDKQKKLGDGIARAVAEARVPHTVILSSIGAEHDGPSGPILGLHWFENALRATSTKLTALRPGYFQENVLMVAQVAKDQGVYPAFFPQAGGLPMIATREIGQEAARVIAGGATGHGVVDLVGPFYNGDAVAAALGKVFGRQVTPVYVPPEAHVGALTQAGLPQEVAELFAEMYTFFREGKTGPRGDRLVQGKVTLEETLRANLS